jgi:Xaa-Pro aminopeptidase
MEQRLNKARTFLKGLDAILFSGKRNITYLCGFSGDDANLLVTKNDAVLFLDSRFTIQANNESQDVKIIEVSQRWADVLEYIEGHEIKCFGLESNMVDVDTFITMKDKLKGVEITPIGRQLKSLRSVKGKDEIEIIQHSSLIAEKALYSVLENGIIGKKEKDIAFAIEWEMKRLGASAVAFDIIVASGPRSAMPHGVASDKVICVDEVVVIDFGCIYKGYCSDQTVTIATGNIKDKFADIYNCAYNAQAKAIRSIRPGIEAKTVDEIARSYIDEHGFGKYFGHSLGHGMGMEVHEAPTIGQRSEDILEEGMVFTIEPGIYIPDKFGVRIEDTFVISNNACQRITNLVNDKKTIKKVR